jgi:uroporphyrinogen-III synthase
MTGGAMTDGSTTSGAGDGPLAGRCIVTTREHRGQLDDLLEQAGAEVIHLPLIAVADAPDGGTALSRALDRLDEFDWVVVSSRNGAERIGSALVHARQRVRVAAVGTITAAEAERHLGRPVDLVPDVQNAAGLVQAFDAAVHEPQTILVAQADLAAPTLSEGLTALGHRVEVCTAYSTRLRTPPAGELERALAADAVVFASGSAATAWAAAVGPTAPPVVCAIGPSTERAALDAGLWVTATATDHSVAGLATCVIDALSEAP